MLVAVLAITAGLSGFLDFNIATYGVYFVSSLGILLMVYRIELQHSLSELIDSKFGSVPGMESEYNSTRSIINTTLVLSLAILLLTSFYALSRQFTLLFAVCLAASAGLFGLFLGRTYNGISSGGSDSWSSQSSDQKYAEFNELRQWLEGGQSSTLSVHVMSKIEKQRSVFVREIESVISDKSSLTPLSDQSRRERNHARSTVEGASQKSPSQVAGRRAGVHQERANYPIPTIVRKSSELARQNETP